MIRLIYMLIGWIVGAILLFQYGGIFATPQKLSSNWRVISPMLEELSGAPQIGLGVHIADGGLRITKHLLYPSDTLVVNTTQEVQKIDIKLSPQSGTLVMSLGNTSKHFMFMDPNFLHPNSPNDNGIALQANEINLQYTDGSLFLVQDGWKQPITTTRPQKIEFMTTSDSAIIEYISLQNFNNEVIFQEDYRQRGKLKHAIELGGILGLLLGLLLSFHKKGYVNAVLQAILVCTPLFFLLQIPRDMWMYFCELLYLSQSTGWELAQYTCISLYTILIFFLFPSTKILSITSRRDPKEQSQTAQWTWMVLALCSIGYQYQEVSLVILYTLFFFLLPLRLARKAQIRSTKWYILDIPTLIFPMILTPEIGILLGIFWRIIILLSNLTQFRKWNATVLADTFFICLVLIPIQTELFLRSTYVDKVWSPEGLKVQYRTDDNSTTLPLTWKGICGTPPTDSDYTIVVSGGSSTGGAYQFKDEPQAFFSTRIHQDLCKIAPANTKLSLFNYGSADLNTHLITKRFPNTSQSKPDILILYVGVNDVLTQRYTQTIRQREDSTSTIQNSIPLLFSSRLLTGLSIPLQNQKKDSEKDLVSEVPPSDAFKNLTELRNHLPKTTQLIVVPEIIVSHLRRELQEYDEMLQNFASQYPENTHYFIPTSKTPQEQDQLLADRNHLSREGNQWLGDEITKKLIEMKLFENK